MPTRLTLEEFLGKANKVHGDEYDYSLVDYKNNSTKVKIICKNHGIFEQKPNSHIDSKHGCPICRYIKSAKSNSDNIYSFIAKAKKIHGNKYDYSLVNYKSSQVKIKILCPKHGLFKQRPQDHLRYKPNCCAEELKSNNKINKHAEEFIAKAIKVHKNKYDYSLVNYKGSITKIKIICPMHGEFKQRPSDHLREHGCPTCGKESSGEKEIRNFLIENNVNFISQKSFDGCIYKNKLRFDFYLIDCNLLIEFDGAQHFKPIKEWGGIKEFERTKIKDKIKNDYCVLNNKILFRIKYTEDLQKKLAEIKEIYLD